MTSRKIYVKLMLASLMVVAFLPSSNPGKVSNLPATGTPGVPVASNIEQVTYDDELFEWGGIGKVNDEANTWEPINDANGVYTEWDAKLASGGTIDVDDNFVNTSLHPFPGIDVLYEVLHMHAQDGSGYDGFNYIQASTIVDISSCNDDFDVYVEVRGERDDNEYDNNYAAVWVIADTDDDGDHDFDDDSLYYIIDDDGNLYYPSGNFNNTREGNRVKVWVNPSGEAWDGNWNAFDRDISEDWLTYHNESLDADSCSIIFEINNRIDSSGDCYMWGEWCFFDCSGVYAWYKESFDWAASEKVNSVQNQWQIVPTRYNKVSGWEAKVSCNETISLDDNLVKPNAGTYFELYMKNTDSSSEEGSKSCHARLAIDISDVKDDFRFGIVAMGYLYEPSFYDDSYGSIKISPDTDGDLDIDDEDKSIEYVLNDDGSFNRMGSIDNKSIGNNRWVYVEIEDDWDDETQYDISANVTKDFLDYHGCSINGDICQVIINNHLEVDLAAGYYLRTQWRAFKTNARPLEVFENFNWGNVSSFNDQANTYQDAKTAWDFDTTWETIVKSGGSIDLDDNFINISLQDQHSYLHFDNIDGDGYDGFNYAHARYYIKHGSVVNDLAFSISVQGKRYDDPTCDTSFASVRILPDTNDDGEFDDDDYSLEYVFDDDGDLSYPNIQINNSVFGNLTMVWINIETDWDGSTWYQISRNVTQDWLDYHGFSLNGTECMVRLKSGARRDSMYGGFFFMWTNWDNMSTNAISPHLF